MSAVRPVLLLPPNRRCGHRDVAIVSGGMRRAATTVVLSQSLITFFNGILISPITMFRRNATPNSNTTAIPSTEEEFQKQSETLIPAEVRMISGCHSEQTSADVCNVGSVAQLPNPAGKSGGACTSALLDILYQGHREKNKMTFQSILLDLRRVLSQRGFEQIPQLTSSRPLELQETPFSLINATNVRKDGTRRAVLVGINYRGQNGQLSGCHNDVWNAKKYIMQHHGYEEKNILELVDDGNSHYPTRGAIILALKQLVAQSKAGDSVYFHYSGE